MVKTIWNRFLILMVFGSSDFLISQIRARWRREEVCPEIIGSLTNSENYQSNSSRSMGTRRLLGCFHCQSYFVFYFFLFLVFFQFLFLPLRELQSTLIFCLFSLFIICFSLIFLLFILLFCLSVMAFVFPCLSLYFFFLSFSSEVS